MRRVVLAIALSLATRAASMQSTTSHQGRALTRVLLWTGSAETNYFRAEAQIHDMNACCSNSPGSWPRSFAVGLGAAHWAGKAVLVVRAGTVPGDSPIAGIAALSRRCSTVGMGSMAVALGVHPFSRPRAPIPASALPVAGSLPASCVCSF